MSGLPVMLQLRNRRCVIIGGGEVALRRARSLLDAGAKVTVIAPEVSPQWSELSVTIQRKRYEPGDLAGCFMAVIATSDAGVNAQASAEAQAVGALVNRADEAEAGDVTVMAHRRSGPLTLAVDTGHSSAAMAVKLRDQAWDAIDPDSPVLLEHVRPWRGWLQQNVPDERERRDKLRKLTDERAWRILKDQGVDALRAHLAVVAGADNDTHPQPR